MLKSHLLISFSLAPTRSLCPSGLLHRGVSLLAVRLMNDDDDDDDDDDADVSPKSGGRGFESREVSVNEKINASQCQHTSIGTIKKQH